MSHTDAIAHYLLHLCKEVPSILQILTFQAFLAILVHNAFIVGLSTSILCGAYLGSRDRFPTEDELPQKINKFVLFDLLFALIMGFVSSLIAVKIVDATN